MLVNNAPIVPKLPKVFSLLVPYPLAAVRACLDNRSMPTYITFIMLCLGILLTAGPAHAEEPATATESTAQVRHIAGMQSGAERLLKQLEPDDELISMEQDGDSFFLIFRPAVAVIPVGNLLILPDLNASDGWAEQSGAISRYLARHGWNTLRLEPPVPPPPTLPERTLPSMRTIHTGSAPESPAEATTEQPDAAAETDTSTASAPETPFMDRVRERLSLANTELQRRGHAETDFNVILGIGSSAPWAAEYAAESEDEWDLVLINPLPDETSGINLNELLPRIEGRIIDLYYLPLAGYPEAAPDAQLRRELATRNGMTDFHQRRLPGVFRGWQTEMPQLTRQLRGIMERVLMTAPEQQVEPATEVIPDNETPPGARNPRPARGPGAA